MGLVALDTTYGHKRVLFQKRKNFVKRRVFRRLYLDLYRVVPLHSHRVLPADVRSFPIIQRLCASYSQLLISRRIGCEDSIFKRLGADRTKTCSARTSTKRACKLDGISLWP